MPDREALIRAVDRRFDVADWGLGRDVATAAVTVVLRELEPAFERLASAAAEFFGALNGGAVADSGELEAAITALVGERRGPSASEDDRV